MKHCTNSARPWCYDGYDDIVRDRCLDVLGLKLQASMETLLVFMFLMNMLLLLAIVCWQNVAQVKRQTA